MWGITSPPQFVHVASSCRDISRRNLILCGLAAFLDLSLGRRPSRSRSKIALKLPRSHQLGQRLLLRLVHTTLPVH